MSAGPAPTGSSPSGNMFTLANQLTLLRMLLIPAFVLLVVYGELGWALVTFLVAGATDALDGLIARTVFADVPPRVEYALKPPAQQLLPILAALGEWMRANQEEVGSAHQQSVDTSADDADVER